jgi:hypothetical protein
VTNTTGATWIAGRACSALISLSTPTPEAAAVDSPQAAAASRCPWARSSEASLVATPLHAKASPAPTIVTTAGERPSKRSTYGSRLESPRLTSTSVIVSSSEVWVVLRGGAASPAPTTPTTIASMAMYS